MSARMRQDDERTQHWPAWALNTVMLIGFLGGLFAMFGSTLAGCIVMAAAILTIKLFADPEGTSWQFTTFAMLAALILSLVGQSFREKRFEESLFRHGYEWASGNRSEFTCPNNPEAFRDGCYRWIDEREQLDAHPLSTQSSPPIEAAMKNPAGAGLELVGNPR